MQNTLILSASIFLAALIVVYLPYSGLGETPTAFVDTVTIENGYARVIIEDNGQDKFLQIRGKLTIKISDDWVYIIEGNTGESYIVPRDSVSYIGKEVKASPPAS